MHEKIQRALDFGNQKIKYIGCFIENEILKHIIEYCFSGEDPSLCREHRAVPYLDVVSL